MSEIQLALIGCGAIAELHAESIAKISGADFLAYVDINESAAKSYLEKFGGEYATTEVNRVLSDSRIRAVYICTTHESHAPLAISAAKAGKHILIEKPLALTSKDCEAIAQVIKETSVYLMPAFKMRYYPLIQKAHEFIPQPQVLVGQMMCERWPDDNWAQDPVKGGGNVFSQGCHTIDIIRYLAGSEPKRLWAAGGSMTHPESPCIDQCVASIQFANGHIASWIQGDAAPSEFTSKFFFELFGESGRSVQIYDRLKKATFFDGKESWTEERTDEEGVYLENKEFVDALLSGREPELTVEDGIQATRILLAADKAIKTGEIQEL